MEQETGKDNAVLELCDLWGITEEQFYQIQEHKNAMVDLSFTPMGNP